LPNAPTSYKWQQTGWNPFIVGSIASISPELIRIGGVAAGKNLDVYVAKRQFASTGDLREEIERSAVQIREQNEEHYRISALLPPVRAVEVEGFASSIKASDLVGRLIRAINRRPSRKPRH
jgi:hypothetical protein